MRLFTTVAGLRCYLTQLRSGQLQPEQEMVTSPCFPLGVSIGLVPTMGALHAGHLSLIQRARQENDWVVVSIFVNPLQFGPHEDFERYPRTLENDRQLCEAAGVDAIFMPDSQELYNKQHRTATSEPLSTAQENLTKVVPPPLMATGLCGQSRPGHFAGVTTIVTKLLNIVQPDRAYFGQKDAQQVSILQQLVADLNLPVELVACPIVREASGLALSSRNQYLSPEQRDQAAVLYRSLQRAEKLFQTGTRMREELLDTVRSELATVPELQPEYIELVHPDTLKPLQKIETIGLLAVAARIGATRLIDNILLRNRQPVLAIDGPAGAGKSTVVRQVAQALGLTYLDTGAMYRAVTWLVLQSKTPIADEAAIAELVSQCQLDISSNASMTQVAINGHDVTLAIRGQEVTAQVSAVSAQAAVRRELVRRQQAYGTRGGIVIDGRDIGTCVFPDAELKIFLTASVQERARRRQQDLQKQGQPDISLSALEQSIYERDLKDTTRRIAPLRKAADAIEIQSDDLSIDQVTAKIVSLYREAIGQRSSQSSHVLNGA